METVVLGLSGGVDSAVAAALLKKSGYTVHGLYLDVGVGGSGEADAKAVAELLDIPLTVKDVRAELEEHVCAPFSAAYLSGRTPLPCARCNRLVKFPALLAEAERLGAAYTATGHYARTTPGEADLRKGAPSNDQSYLLARLTPEQLTRILFPLGEYEKAEVRAMAEALGLPVARKKDSMEICFIPDNDYAAWLERRGSAPPPGNFVTADGRVLGRHKGIHCYTIGQRRGLGIPAEHRLFVSAIVPERNEVVLSDGGDLMAEDAYGVGLNVLLSPLPQEVTVRLRHSRQETPAALELRDGQVHISLKTPARAPTPGQLAVFYDGDRVAGSAWLVPKEETVWN